MKMKKLKNTKELEVYKKLLTSNIHRPHFVYMAEHKDFADFLLEIVDTVLSKALTQREAEVREEVIREIGRSCINPDCDNPVMGLCNKCSVQHLNQNKK